MLFIFVVSFMVLRLMMGGDHVESLIECSAKRDFFEQERVVPEQFHLLRHNPVDFELFDRFTVRSIAISDSYVRCKPIAVHCLYCCGLH